MPGSAHAGLAGSTLRQALSQCGAGLVCRCYIRRCYAPTWEGLEGYSIMYCIFEKGRAGSSTRPCRP